MALLALKIDADTYMGTREGVPLLARLLQKHDANATFLFSLGPDHTGWALRRIFRPGFLKKVSRTSVAKHYGLRTLMYGIMLPAPDIGAKLANEMRSIAASGFECGIHCWDHVVWQDRVSTGDEPWTEHHLSRAVERFRDIFGCEPLTHGAAGWQMNAHAFICLDRLGFTHASDTRCLLKEDGSLADPDNGPCRVRIDGRELECIQLPTTLPTLDELLGRSIGHGIVDESNIARTLLDLTGQPRNHVFTLHAELEGRHFSSVFEALLAGWKAQGYRLVSLQEYGKAIAGHRLASKAIGWGEIPGRSGKVLVQ